MSFLINNANAQEVAASTAAAPPLPGTPGPSATDALMQFLPLFLILMVFYFVLLRPQQKKFKEHKAMLDNLRRGDKIVTSGGIIGSIVKLDGEQQLVIEIADGVQIKVMRSYVQELVAKPEPANSNEK